MTNLVIDTSVIMAVIANEPEKAALISLTAGTSLIAPASVPWEIGNAFSAMLKRKRINLEQAHQALEAYRKIPLRLVEIDLAEALTVAHQFGIYAYDAYVIQCAQQMRCNLITLDEGRRRAGKLAGVTVLEIPK